VPDGTLVEAPFGCRPDLESGEKISWIAITTPAWLPLVIRNVVRGDGIAIGNVILGPTDFEEQDREPVGLVPHSGKAGNDRWDVIASTRPDDRAGRPSASAGA
jgi:hypothetical protein